MADTASFDDTLFNRIVTLVDSPSFPTLRARNLVSVFARIRGVLSLPGAGYTSTWFLVEANTLHNDSQTVLVTVPEQCVVFPTNQGQTPVPATNPAAP